MPIKFGKKKAAPQAGRPYPPLPLGCDDYIDIFRLGFFTAAEAAKTLGRSKRVVLRKISEYKSSGHVRVVGWKQEGHSTIPVYGRTPPEEFGKSYKEPPRPVPMTPAEKCRRYRNKKKAQALDEASKNYVQDYI